MTKVLVVSDSHGLTDELLQLKAKHNDIDIWLHCGDSELTKDEKYLAGFVTVRGNCDYEAKFLHDELINVNGTKVFLTHGHLYQVKSSLMSLKYKAEELGAEIACFGHSHLLGAEVIDDILFINPGSLRLPRGRSEHTYVILEINKPQVQLRVYDLHTGEIKTLRQTFLLHK